MEWNNYFLVFSFGNIFFISDNVSCIIDNNSFTFENFLFFFDNLSFAIVNFLFRPGNNRLTNNILYFPNFLYLSNFSFISNKKTFIFWTDSFRLNTNLLI